MFKIHDIREEHLMLTESQGSRLGIHISTTVKFWFNKEYCYAQDISKVDSQPSSRRKRMAKIVARYIFDEINP